MSVIRVVHNTNYTTMSNFHLQDKNLSLKAKGLLSFCLSLPDTWDYSVSGLVKVCMEGRDCIMSTLAELEQKGYLHRERRRNTDGTLGAADYVIYEHPHLETADKPTLEYPASENPTQDIPASEKPRQINTKLISTKRNNNERNKEERHPYGLYQNVLLTDEEYKKLTDEFPSDYEERIDRLSEYMASTGRSYKCHLATIQSWAHKEAPKAKGYSHDIYRCKEGEGLYGL